MTGFFSYDYVSPKLTPNDSTVFSPPFQALRNDGATAASAVIIMPNNHEVTLANIQPGQIVPVTFKTLKTGSATDIQGLYWRST